MNTVFAVGAWLALFWLATEFAFTDLGENLLGFAALALWLGWVPVIVLAVLFDAGMIRTWLGKDDE